MASMKPPAVFVSHGAPSLPLEPGPTAGFLRDLGRSLGKPRGVVCISAHWERAQPQVTAAPHLETIHDFGGFPEELYAIRYPAPGDPALAGRVVATLEAAGVRCGQDAARGLDHGAWVPLMLIYPEADVPVVQLSVQTRLGPAHHLALGQALRPLRDDGILILGSGGATHNLGAFGEYDVGAPPAGYAAEFDAWLNESIESGREADLLDYRARAPHATRNHPTAEHFLPLFIPLGAATPGRAGRRIHAAFTYGVISMAAFAWD